MEKRLAEIPRRLAFSALRHDLLGIGRSFSPFGRNFLAKGRSFFSGGRNLLEKRRSFFPPRRPFFGFRGFFAVSHFLRVLQNSAV